MAKPQLKTFSVAVVQFFLSHRELHRLNDNAERFIFTDQFFLCVIPGKFIQANPQPDSIVKCSFKIQKTGGENCLAHAEPPLLQVTIQFCRGQSLRTMCLGKHAKSIIVIDYKLAGWRQKMDYMRIILKLNFGMTHQHPI